ncbi:hypothetical protein BST61_g11458 [Cercospora zeina]
MQGPPFRLLHSTCAVRTSFQPPISTDTQEIVVSRCTEDFLYSIIHVKAITITGIMSRHTYTYGKNAYTGEQLLLRQRPPNSTRPIYNLTLSPEAGAFFQDFCNQHHLGGQRSLPTPHLLCELANGLQYLHMGESDEVVTEVLRRLAKRVQGLHEVNSSERVEGEHWDVNVDGTLGTLVEQALELWKKTVAAELGTAKDKTKKTTMAKGKGKATLVPQKVGNSLSAPPFTQPEPVETAPEPEQPLRRQPAKNSTQQRQPQQTLDVPAPDNDDYNAEVEHLRMLEQDYQVLRAVDKALAEKAKALEI